MDGSTLGTVLPSKVITMTDVFIPRLTKKESCYNKGHAAYNNGEPVENNPYTDTDYQVAWEQGWYQGQWEAEHE